MLKLKPNYKIVVLADESGNTVWIRWQVRTVNENPSLEKVLVWGKALSADAAKASAENWIQSYLRKHAIVEALNDESKVWG